MTGAALCLAAGGGCRMAANGQNMEGVRLFQNGQYQAAMQKFQQVVTRDPSNADGYYNLAATVHRMGTLAGNNEMKRQAETLYNQCLDLDENHVDCRRGLAVLLVETDRRDRAFKLMENWAMSDPQSAEALIELARLHEESGSSDTAKLHLQQALQVDHHNARAWAALGKLREKSGELNQALANYQRSYNLNSFQPAVASRIAALNRSISGGIDATRPGGTRTVRPGGANIRY